MKKGALTEKRLGMLGQYSAEYRPDAGILDGAGRGGLVAGVVSSPQAIEPEQGLVAVWGGADYVPRWASEKEMTRFRHLHFQHLADPETR
ncbi:UPF0149 family protein [Escherichia coli]|nr:UPF0149 family protein [Escherichia coli]